MQKRNVVRGPATPAAFRPLGRSGRPLVRRGVAGVAVALTLCFAATGAHAQKDYPTKPIRLMTPFAPGGGTDILSRLLGPQVAESLGQQFVVDNRPGGGGTLGAGLAVRAVPDGYTLITVSASYGANPVMHKLAFDSVEDITPIILIGETGLCATMNPKSPIKTVKDMIAYARANPGKLQFGSAGVGGLGHLAQELFRLATKVDINHVPYKGSGPVMNALLSGEVQSSFSSCVPSIPHIRAGRLHAIGVTTPWRIDALKEVPTISETVPGYEVTHWYGIWGPKGIPPEIVARLNREFAKVLHSPRMAQWFEAEGMRPAGGPPEQFRDRIKSDVEKWTKLAKEAGIGIYAK